MTQYLSVGGADAQIFFFFDERFIPVLKDMHCLGYPADKRTQFHSHSTRRITVVLWLSVRVM